MPSPPPPPAADDAKLPTLCKADGSDPEPGSEEAKEGPYWSLMFEVRVRDAGRAKRDKGSGRCPARGTAARCGALHAQLAGLCVCC